MASYLKDTAFLDAPAQETSALPPDRARIAGFIEGERQALPHAVVGMVTEREGETLMRHENPA